MFIIKYKRLCEKINDKKELYNKYKELFEEYLKKCAKFGLTI